MADPPGVPGPARRREPAARAELDPGATALLDGVNVGALALLAVVGVQLGHAALVDVTTVAILAAALVLLLGTRLNPTWIVVGGGAVGMLWKA